MALINSSNTRRIVPPHEPESWFDVRPIVAGDFEGFQADASQVRLSLDLLASLITAWSYDAPVSRENVRQLDLETFTWLNSELLDLSGVRSADEKKDSDNGSSPVAARASSRRNSAT